MIATDWYKEAEFAYKMKATLYPEYKKELTGYDYLSKKLNEFCRLTGVKPYEVFKRSRKEYYVAIKVAFTRFLGDYSPFRIGKFLSYDHSTVYHWRRSHRVYRQFEFYKKLLKCINTN